MHTINENQMYCSWNVEHDRLFCHFGPFFALLSHPTPKYNNRKYQNFEKIKNNSRYYHFTHVYQKVQSYDVWFLRNRAQWTEFFVILTIFCPFTPYKPEKSKFWKNEKNSLRYHFTQVYQKWRSCAILFLIYGTWQM